MNAPCAKVLHIEDVEYYAASIEKVLQSWPEVKHIGTASSGATGLALSRELSPDIVLLDLGLPDLDGFEVLDRLAQIEPSPHVVLLTQRLDEAALFRAGMSPVSGMVWKSGAAHLNELKFALAEIAAGRSYFSADVREAVRRMRRAHDAFFKILTPRQIGLLPLFGYGLDDATIAARAGSTAGTVKSHRKHVMAKLGLHRTEDLMVWCARKGFSNLAGPGARDVLPR